MSCRWHRGLCAYDDTDLTRCPWCHASWWTITDGRDHSCETWHRWTGTDTRWRVTTARKMRQEATQGTRETQTALTKGKRP